MPSVVDVVELLEALKSKPILVATDKCVAVRNRNSHCTKCIDACPVDGVITVGNNKLDVDADSCAACGACTAVCPTEALVSLTPMDADLANQVASACLETGDGQAVIACARIAAKHIADPRKFAEVPCLCRVDESILLGLVAHGIDHVLMVDGGCASCKYRETRGVADTVIASTNDLLEAWGDRPRIERAENFPDSCRLEDERGLYGEARRNFFGGAKDTAKEAAIAAATKTLNLEQEDKSLRDRLQVGGGRMPQFEAVRRMNMLDSLDRIGEPVAESIDTRLWGRVEIDVKACNGCGMCAVFCPTGALSKASQEEREKSASAMLFEFTCSECVQCGLCVDACFKKCLKVSTEVRTDELLDFEPRIIEVESRESSTDLFSRDR